jgi:hypothetical protein
VVEPDRLARHSVLPDGDSHVMYVVEPIVVDRQRVPACTKLGASTARKTRTAIRDFMSGPFWG